ncbi:hypothetical protein [Micromonospora phaseoli]|uniref:hypothetical protein n=1 Tax=Micromonospora phaseoli TaxID=1144548 RepID=UPI001E65D8CC
MLSYLHACTDAGVVVTGYLDRAAGVMIEDAGTGQLTEAVLRPEVTVASPDMVEAATRLHDVAPRRRDGIVPVAAPLAGAARPPTGRGRAPRHQRRRRTVR